MDFIAVGSSILAFIVAIGILVTVHEFGHFWVARKLGVKLDDLLISQRLLISTQYVRCQQA